MNNINSNSSTQTNINDSTFGDESPQTNPFTGDLKGEFTSDFGTNTNAVSQIFRGNGMGGEHRNKIIMVVVLILAIVAAVVVYSLDSGSDMKDEDLASEDIEEGSALDEDGALEGEEGAQDSADSQLGEESASDGEEAAESMDESYGGAESGYASRAAGSGGAIAIVQPNDGAAVNYDETQGPAVFSWEGAADRIVFSRSSSMAPVERSVPLGGSSSYSFDRPYPGNWFWHVENASGASEVRRFVVNAPERRNFPVAEPSPGGVIAGNGGVVAWQGDEKVARYQVQVTPLGSSWANPQYRFGTAGNSIALSDVPPGQYDIRVGAFSEVAGRWEWQVISGITVQ